MSDPRVEQLIRGLKKLVDEFEPSYRAHGPMRVRFFGPPPGAEAPWSLVIEAGWDHNFGGKVTIESSKTGKSLRVYREGKELRA